MVTRLRPPPWSRASSPSIPGLSLASPWRCLGKLPPDLVLAAAAKVGIAGLALSSLNWADIYRTYCADVPGAVDVLNQILAAYRAAQGFIACAPTLPMPDLETTPVGPVALLGRRLRDQAGL